jgi:hypothetical protein
MRIYVVLEDDKISGAEIVGVFSSKEKADLLGKESGAYFMCEADLDDGVEILSNDVKNNADHIQHNCDTCGKPLKTSSLVKDGIVTFLVSQCEYCKGVLQRDTFPCRKDFTENG